MECVYEARRLLCDYASQPMSAAVYSQTTPSPFSQQHLIKQPISEVEDDTELSDQTTSTDTVYYTCM